MPSFCLQVINNFTHCISNIILLSKLTRKASIGLKAVKSIKDGTACEKEFLFPFQAISWCPWQTRLLATGGGTSDRHIRFWNTNSGTCVKAVDTQSQVWGIVHRIRTYVDVESICQYTVIRGRDSSVNRVPDS